MKKSVLFVLVVAVIVVVVLIAVCVSRQFAHRDEPVAERLELHTFERVTLRVIGMRFDRTYEILNQETGVTLSCYDNVYENGEAVQKLNKTVICGRDAMLELLQTCHVGAWNGFYGAHPEDVSDGTMFLLTAVVNDGQTIRAEGSENFPEGYREFLSALKMYLEEQN